MADFSLVKDQRNVIRGIWLKNSDEANDIYFLTMLTTRIAKDERGSFPEEYIGAILAKKYRVVANTYSDDGGCFVMFGNSPAPGESQPLFPETPLSGEPQVKDRNKTKQCGVCGNIVEEGLLQCPKCGRGVFQSEKLREKRQVVVYSETTKRESDLDSKRTWLDKLLGRKRPQAVIRREPDTTPKSQSSAGIWKKKVNGAGEERKATVFLYPVDRQSVETCSEKEIISIKNYLKNITTVSIAKQRLNRFKLTISGYGDDPRELYEIPEVCRWARYCFQKIPYLIYFLDDASAPPFISWLLGPISKTVAFSKEFEGTFSTKLTEVMLTSSHAASEYIITLGGDDKLFLLFSTQRTTK